MRSIAEAKREFSVDIPNRCPICDSPEIQFSDYQRASSALYQEGSCSACGTTFEIVFPYEGIEDIVVGDDNTPRFYRWQFEVEENNSFSICAIAMSLHQAIGYVLDKIPEEFVDDFLERSEEYVVEEFTMPFVTWQKEASWTR